MVNIRITSRDEAVIKAISKFRFCLSRQLKVIAGFSSQRTCDRRIKKLRDVGYIERKYVVYGVPGLYFLTKKATQVFTLELVTSHIRIDQINHTICVIDTAIYFLERYHLTLDDFTTERELKSSAGFEKAKHCPDIIFENEQEKYCIEVELSTKRGAAIEKNIRENYLNFDKQIWVVRRGGKKIRDNLVEYGKKYPNISMIDLEEVQRHVKAI